MLSPRRLLSLIGLAQLSLILPQPHAQAADSDSWQRQFEKLDQKNALLEQQLRQQQTLIDALNRKVSDLEKQRAAPAAEPARPEPEPAPGLFNRSKPFQLGNLMITGEGGLAFFHQGSHGQFPNAEFRVDEAKLFLEAPIWENVFFFTEVNIALREEPDQFFRMGELYLDFENISRLWNKERWVNLRAGRLDIPFGEEYLARDAIDNPLITHSIMDFWGVDEGIELYGALGKFQYALAVLNGGNPFLRDYAADKSVVGRVSYDPFKWAHLSVSGMRTGDLDVHGDELSSLWVGNGFFRALGSLPGTTRFHANLWEGDLQLRSRRRYLKMAGGFLQFDDNDPAADNRREVYYYYLEGFHALSDRWYVSTRFSQAFAPKGFPLMGLGEYGQYFLSDLTTDLWRWSLGLGYRWSRNLVVKTEYSFEGGRILSGSARDHENLFALEAAFRF